MFDTYSIELTLLRDVLGTNPLDPHVLDSHILEKQRKLILEKSGINSEINKYLGQLEISKEKSDEEKQLLIEKLENLIGREFSEEEKVQAIRGELTSLKETFKEMDLRGVTVFLFNKKTGKPCIGDHMVYGFMKASAEAIGRTLPKKNGTILQSVSYTQSIINQHVRCDRQFIDFDRDIKREADGSPWYMQRSLRAMTAQGPRITLAKSEVVEAGAKLIFNLKVMQNSPLKEEVIKKIFSYGEFTGLGSWRNAGWGLFSFEMSKA